MSGMWIEIQPQPDDTTCGPTCLHSVYRYYDDEVPLDSIIAEVPSLEAGGTLAVFLACHALRRGYEAVIYSYNLQIFDPTWFADAGVDIQQKLIEQLELKHEEKLRVSTRGYIEFLRLGGVVRIEDLTTALIRRHLNRKHPILSGLSATYLYRNCRERGPDNVADDVLGEPVGHFVVLCGYEKLTRNVLVADPLQSNPLSADRVYPVAIERVIGAILLGTVTYDANLLILTPRARKRERARR